MSVDRHRPKLSDWLLEQLGVHEWSYRALGRKIGVHGSSVGHWVNGRSIPEPEHCRSLAEVFGAEPDYVLWLAGHRELPEGPVDLSDPLVSAAAANQHMLTREQKAALIELMRSMADGQPPHTR